MRDLMDRNLLKNGKIVLNKELTKISTIVTEAIAILFH